MHFKIWRGEIKRKLADSVPAWLGRQLLLCVVSRSPSPTSLFLTLAITFILTPSPPQLYRVTQRLPPPLNPGDTWMEETRKAQLTLFGVRRRMRVRASVCVPKSKIKSITSPDYPLAYASCMNTQPRICAGIVSGCASSLRGQGGGECRAVRAVVSAVLPTASEFWQLEHLCCVRSLFC